MALKPETSTLRARISELEDDLEVARDMIRSMRVLKIGKVLYEADTDRKFLHRNLKSGGLMVSCSSESAKTIMQYQYDQYRRDNKPPATRFPSVVAAMKQNEKNPS